MSATATEVENKIELTRFEAKSFMGISSDSPVVLDFTRNRKKKNVTIFEGNQGVGKSSTMTALMYMLGAELEFKKENIVNLKDDTVSLSFEFSAKGINYRVRVNKSKFVLEQWSADAKTWFGAGEPKATLKKILGPVATSPMRLKELRGRDQIKWFREYFTEEHEGPGRKSKEETIMDELQQKTKLRTEYNRDYDRIKKSLLNNDLFLNYEDNLEKFKKPVSIEEVRAALQQANEQKVRLDNGKARVQQYESEKLQRMRRIQELEEELRRENEQYESVLGKIEDGNTWLKANEETITLNFANAQKNFEEFSKLAVEYENWQRVVEDKKIMDELESGIIKLDADKDELRTKLLELTKKYLPKMKGLELKVASGIDGEETKEGLFYNGKSLAQLSESELWEIFLAICDHNEVNFVFVENVNSLGSNAVAVLNQLADHDVKIFATEQNRKVNELRITITDKID